ncbi:hypothetical protein BGX28_005945 [Mortierella sp. GBA30]|nr:hypothetical protein BGX28_005945 [Mortierella sp. GBA30]
MSADYQHFRSRGELVRIKLTTNPTTGRRYIFWSDLRMCFPGLVRVQHQDIFIPFMRCLQEYRIKPLRIEYVPDVLDIIYKDDMEASTPLPFSMPKSILPSVPFITSTVTGRTSSAPLAQGLPTVVADPQIAPSLLLEDNDAHRIQREKGDSSSEGMDLTKASKVHAEKDIETNRLPRIEETDFITDTNSSAEWDPNSVEEFAIEDRQDNIVSGHNTLETDLSPDSNYKDTNEICRIKYIERLGSVTSGYNESQATTKNDDSNRKGTHLTEEEARQHSSRTSSNMQSLQTRDKSVIGIMNKALEKAISHSISGTVETKPSATGKKKGSGRTQSGGATKKASAVSMALESAEESQALVRIGPPSPAKQHTQGREEDKGQKEAVFNFEAAKNGLVETTHLFQAFIQASAKGQLSVADKIGLQLSRQLEDLEIKLEMGSQLRPQFAQLCKALSDTQRSLHLIREPLIQNRIQTILDQKLGVVDQLFPRLFIILPKAGSTCNEFRVHFLCECGSHPHDASSKLGVPTYIHLTDHEGYDIDFQDEFIEKFGSYMLDFLNMLKYGVMLEGMFIPPLEDSSELMAQVNRSMEYLMDVSSSELDGKDWLNTLSTYLKNSAKDSCLGHLYRTVSKEGYASWICFDHYNELGYEPLVTKFAEAYTRCAAHYVDGHQGLVHVMIQHRHQADSFYKALDNEPPIHDLGILLDWDITVNDINNLQQALRKSRVPIIRICLPRCEKPADVLKQAKDGLITFMLSNMRTQCFLFGDFTDQLRRFEPNTRLLIIRRALDMTHWRRDNVTVAIIVRDTQKWTKVSLFNRDIERGLEMVKKSMGGDFHRLKTLALDTGTEERALIEFDNGEMTSLELRALWPTSNYLLLSSFIRKLQVTIALEQNYPELARIVKRNQGLVELDINCLMKNMADVFMLIKKLAQDHPNLNQIRLRNDGTMLSWCDVDMKGVGPSMSLNAFEYRGLDPILRLVAAELNFFSGQLNDVQAVILERATGSHLDASTSVASASASTSTSTSTALTSTVKDKSRDTGGSKLRVLSLEISPLTQHGFDAIYHVIENSPKLDRLEVKIWCRPGYKLDWNRYASFVARIGHRNNALQLQGGNVNAMLQHLSSKIPDPYSTLKVLNTFEMRGESVVPTSVPSTSAGAGANGHASGEMNGSATTSESKAGRDAGSAATNETIDETTGGTAATTTAALTSTATASSQTVNVTKLREKHVPWIASVLRLSTITNLMIRKIWIDAGSWDIFLEAINFTNLVSIDIQASNFGVEQMDKLVALVPGPSHSRSEGKIKNGQQSSIQNGADEPAVNGVKNEVEKAVVVMASNGGTAAVETSKWDVHTQRLEGSSVPAYARLNDVNIHLSVKPTNELKQHWELQLKRKCRDLLFQCEADF